MLTPASSDSRPQGCGLRAGLHLLRIRLKLQEEAEDSDQDVKRVGQVTSPYLVMTSEELRFKDPRGSDTAHHHPCPADPIPG